MMAEYRCAVCGETNETIIDESAGETQTYIEDCQICCRPNVLRITIHGEDVTIEAMFEE